MKRLQTLFLFGLVFFQSCTLTEDDIKEQSWKFQEGFNVGDWIEFNNSPFSLSSNKIYQNGKPVANIISSRISTFGSKRTITIESVEKKEKGVYVEK